MPGDPAARLRRAAGKTDTSPASAAETSQSMTLCGSATRAKRRSASIFPATNCAPSDVSASQSPMTRLNERPDAADILAKTSWTCWSTLMVNRMRDIGRRHGGVSDAAVCTALHHCASVGMVSLGKASEQDHTASVFLTERRQSPPDGQARRPLRGRWRARGWTRVGREPAHRESPVPGRLKRPHPLWATHAPPSAPRPPPAARYASSRGCAP